MLQIKAGLLVAIIATASVAGAGVGYGAARAFVTVAVTTSQNDADTSRQAMYDNAMQKFSHGGTIDHTPGKAY